MTGTVHALLVGIDHYASPAIDTLRGAVADIEAVEEFLRGRLPGKRRLKKLADVDATRDGIVSIFRRHFADAGPGDVALFWYCGHGSEQTVAPEHRHLEPTGMNQTIVCHDSRHHGVDDLADKELSVLLDEVAVRGVHVVAVLDCCHSGGGTREPDVSYRGIPAAAPATHVRAIPDTVPTGGPPAHVALAACRSFEYAREQRIDGRIRGVFTAALLAALRTQPPGATYRELLTTAKCRVENMTSQQIPVLYPVDRDGPADLPFLGGTVSRPGMGFVARFVHQRWQVDGGSCHGVLSPTEDEPVLFAVAGDGPVRFLRASSVGTATSSVDPVGWRPETDRQYPVLLVAMPLPSATVVLGGLPEEDAGALRLVRDALGRAAPGHGPSPHVRIAPPDTTGPGLRLRVSAVSHLPFSGGRGYRILRGDGEPATAEIRDHTPAAAGIVAARLEHIAQWTHLKDLTNQGSPLAGIVRMEITTARPDPPTTGTGPVLSPDAHGDIRLAYRPGASGWKPPEIVVRLHNTWHRPLWCVLLNLTDRYRVHPGLLTGTWIGPDLHAYAYGARPIPVTLPPGREVRPGVRGQDWLKLIVSDEEFEALAFELPRMDEPVVRGGTMRARSLVDRLGLRIRTRDAGAATDLARPADWSTTTVSIVTEVPAASP